MVALGHAIYLDGRNGVELITSEPTLKLSGFKDTESSCCSDEGIGIKENIEETKGKSNIEVVIEGVVHDIVDKSLSQSLEKTHNSDGEKEKLKSGDAMNGTQNTMFENTLDSFKALGDTPIKLIPNISSGSSF